MARDKERLKRIVELHTRIIQSPFGSSAWKKIGALTGFLSQIDSHPRLLRSLSFGDEDYDGHALTMLEEILDDDPANFRIIKEYLDANFPDTSGENVSSTAPKERRVHFSPSVFEIPSESVDPKLVSVMMPFAAGFDMVYATIQTAVGSCGLHCERADNVWEHSVVIQDIFSLIFRSQIVVCDFSGKNPNVFYEAGIAHTLGKHVIPITQSGDDVPFDLKHHKYLAYQNDIQGLRTMKTKLETRLKTLST